MHGDFGLLDVKKALMSALDNVANRLNLAFWSLLEAVGFVFKSAGLFAVLAGLVVIGEQTMTFMQYDYWTSKSVYWAVPRELMIWITAVGDLAGVTDQIVVFLTWLPLSAAAFILGVFSFLLGRVLARDH
jgi:hypothetical protein